MPDPITTGIVAGGLIASKEILTKLLGPTADYFGETSRDLIKKSADNLGRVFQSACRKLGKGLDDAGQVNPRVFKHICDEGRFIESTICAEYFGGLLASARTEDGADDSAIPLVTLLKSLSSNELRLHFIIYSLVAKHRFGSSSREGRAFWTGLELRVAADEVQRSLGLTGPDADWHLTMALTGLVDQRLIERGYAIRSGDLSLGAIESLQDNMLAVGPNERGAALFFRALGLRGQRPETITSIDLDRSLSEDVKTSISLPTIAACRHRVVTDPIDELLDAFRDEVDGRVSDLECALDEVKDDVSDLKGTIP